MCHFACTIDSAELERDLAPLSGMLPAPMVLHEVRRFGFCAQFMQWNFGGNSQLLLRVFRGVCLHIWLGQEFAGGLVVFIPPKAKPPKLCEHAQAHTVFKRYHYNRVQKRKKE